MPRRATSRPQGRSQRQLRVGEELRHALAAILSRHEMRDPALQEAAVTVTEVRVSPDLKAATAFVMPLGGSQAAEVLAALRRAAPFVRGLIGREVELRFVPTLSFELDNSFEHASRIEKLLHRPDVARDLRRGGDGDADGA